MAQTTELHRAKRGMAVLVTCLVETLNKSDPSFKDQFLETMEQAYHKVKDSGWGDDVIQELELLQWTREFLTGFSRIEGQGKPFLSD